MIDEQPSVLYLSLHNVFQLSFPFSISTEQISTPVIIFLMKIKALSTLILIIFMVHIFQL